MYYIPGYIKIQEVENKIILVNQYTNASVSLETKYKEELKRSLIMEVKILLRSWKYS